MISIELNRHQKALYSISLFAICLSITRVAYTGNYSFLFLIWNLFLAWIPYWISNTKFKEHNSINFKLFCYVGIWLLFLPNAPYLLTDLVHFHSTSKTKWLDLVLLSTYAISGILLFYFSLQHFKNNFLLKRRKKSQLIILIGLILICSYGIYLGRELRFNSWDIFTNPIKLFLAITKSVFHKDHLLHTGALTLLFALFLYISTLVFDNLFYQQHEKKN